VLDCIDDEVESGRGKPIDIESLLVSVLPSILGMSGELLFSPTANKETRISFQNIHSFKEGGSCLRANTLSSYLCDWLVNTWMRLSKS